MSTVSVPLVEPALTSVLLPSVLPFMDPSSCMVPHQSISVIKGKAANSPSSSSFLPSSSLAASERQSFASSPQRLSS